jgi:hypothetical protein
MHDMDDIPITDDLLVNRVAGSGIITLDLEEYYNTRPRLGIDLADWLYERMILKEKDFREKVAVHDWARYANANVAVFCTEDALIPSWAYMLIFSRLATVANHVYAGSPEALEEDLFRKAIAENVLPEAFAGKRVVVKGCSNHPVPAYAYAEVTRLLAPVVSSLMYGEACSAVPILKNKKSNAAPAIQAADPLRVSIP